MVKHLYIWLQEWEIFKCLTIWLKTIHHSKSNWMSRVHMIDLLQHRAKLAKTALSLLYRSPSKFSVSRGNQKCKFWQQSFIGINQKLWMLDYFQFLRVFQFFLATTLHRRCSRFRICPISLFSLDFGRYTFLDRGGGIGCSKLGAQNTYETLQLGVQNLLFTYLRFKKWVDSCALDSTAPDR